MEGGKSCRMERTIKLATKQYRLRNLNRIEGVNIVTDREERGTGIYYSLHYNKDGEAFYKSESLPRHMQQKWAEINCPEMFKANNTCICVKVWLKIIPANDITEKEQSLRTADDSSSDPLADKLLFCWGVYFSGLALLDRTNDVEFAKNSLIFQLNGFDFSSPEYFSVGNPKEPPTSTYQRGAHTESLVISSSPESFAINSPRLSRSSSPINAEIRLIEINCNRNEVRRSYDLNKLLRIQEAQRQRLRTLKESSELISDIKQLCLHCITPEQLKRPGRTISSSYGSSKHNQQHQQYHSMGRKLSKLLAEDDHVEPAALLHAQKLYRELESLRFRNGLLVTEQKTLKARVEDMKNKLSTITAERIQLKQNLEIQFANIEKEKTLLEETYKERTVLLNRRESIVQSLDKRRAILIAELQEIYPIKRNEHGVYTICDIPCPSLETIAYRSNNPALDQISPLALRASMGYIAHLVKMISIIIDQPLRSPLTIDETWIHYYTPKSRKSSTS